jgi:SAM-dependent methyltransferase
LELGCGIGVFTFLLSKIIRKGNIEAVDISNKSIAFCKQKIKNSNIQFVAADIVNYTPVFYKPDFITLLDVIEHIPVDEHPELFKNLATLCMDNTKVVINIPNPSYIEYDIKNHPDALQLIDQPLPLNFILDNLNKNNLELIYFETYSVWVENDYQFLIAAKRKEFKEIFLKK